MGFGRLRVWNDDEVAPGTGFDPHPHREMEIVTYIREGAITHRDNLGNEGRTEAGDVQVMHAGTGIVHAEYNRETAPTRLFQIWILPDRHGVAPGWGTRQFPRAGGLAVLASGRRAGCRQRRAAAPCRCRGAGRHAARRRDGARCGSRPAAGPIWCRRADAVTVNGSPVGTRDGAAITGEAELAITATANAELVLVDVAA